MQYKISKAFTIDGRRYYIKANSEAEAIEKMARKKAEMGKRKIDKQMLVKDWAVLWLDTYIKPRVSKDTLKNYPCYLKPMLEEVGNLRLESVRPIMLQAALNKQAGRSASYVGKVRQTMTRCFESAVDNRLLLISPASNLTMPKTTRGSHRALTKREQPILLAVCEEHPAGLWAKVLLYCGLRPGEAERIEGRDISGNLLHVRGTKTENADRYVPIPSFLKMPKIGPFERLFQNADRYHARRWWKSIMRAMQIKAGAMVYRNKLIPPLPINDDLTPYCLRHTFCTNLQDAGVPINVARELMGHADIRTTSAVYFIRPKKRFPLRLQKWKYFGVWNWRGTFL